MADDWIGVRPRRLDARAVRSKATKVQEERIAERLGGKRVPGSGSRRSTRACAEGLQTDGYDIDLDDFAIEHKRTERASISIKYEWLEKISKRADRSSRWPGVVITFERPGAELDNDWVMVPLDVFNALREDVSDE